MYLPWTNGVPAAAMTSPAPEESITWRAARRTSPLRRRATTSAMREPAFTTSRVSVNSEGFTPASRSISSEIRLYASGSNETAYVSGQGSGTK